MTMITKKENFKKSKTRNLSNFIIDASYIYIFIIEIGEIKKYISKIVVVFGVCIIIKC